MIGEYLDAGDERANLPPDPFPSTSAPPEPTERDYERGYFERFFVRRRGTTNIFEVSEGEWRQFSDSRYFVRFSLNWMISGPRNDVFNDEGYPIQTGVEDTNQRVIEQTRQRGIEEKLTDPLQYWDGRNRNE